MTNLLLVEDNMLFNQTLREHLKEAFPRVQVSPCRTGEEALRTTTGHLPDIVVMDCQLPGCNSRDLLDQLLKRAPRARIIVTSSEPPAALTQEKYQKNIFEFMEKPFSAEELVYVVGRAIRLESAIPPDAVGDNDVTTDSQRETPCSRHKLLNALAGILTGIRAFEADLEAEAENPDAIREMVADYVPRIVGMINDTTAMIRNKSHLTIEDD